MYLLVPMPEENNCPRPWKQALEQTLACDSACYCLGFGYWVGPPKREFPNWKWWGATCCLNACRTGPLCCLQRRGIEREPGASGRRQSEEEQIMTDRSPCVECKGCNFFLSGHTLANKSVCFKPELIVSLIFMWMSVTVTCASHSTYTVFVQDGHALSCGPVTEFPWRIKLRWMHCCCWSNNLQQCPWNHYVRLKVLRTDYISTKHQQTLISDLGGGYWRCMPRPSDGQNQTWLDWEVGQKVQQREVQPGRMTVNGSWLRLRRVAY